MFIKTLTYIHNLLIEDVEKYKNAKNDARKIVEKAEEEEATNAEYLREQYNNAFNKWQEVISFLRDFESTEF